MNTQSKQLIDSEYYEMQQQKTIADNTHDSMAAQTLRAVAENANINARWGNAANIFTAYAKAIDNALVRYQQYEIDEKQFVKIVAEATALARNDQKDGILYIEKLFNGAHSAQSQQIEAYFESTFGTTDRRRTYQMSFTRAFKDNP